MSMDFSEFLRRMGAEPRSKDPEILSARQSGPEFEQAAQAAEDFERQLDRAMDFPAPEELLSQLKEISRQPPPAPVFRWRSMAIAAGLLVAVGAAGITWNMNRGWESVDQYLVEHYQHDGNKLLIESGHRTSEDVQAIFSTFDVKISAELAQIVSVIKYCPTPDGKGVHMVLNTEQGPVTVIYMPDTDVEDHGTVEFDSMSALLVGLDKGSAALIGTNSQSISRLYSVVHDSIVPVVNKA